jgi:hypothetical protein
MPMARRVTTTPLGFATTTAAVATSTTHCSGRRKVTHKGAAVSVPCTKTSRDTTLFGLDIDGTPEALCSSCSTHLGDDAPRRAETYTTIQNGSYQGIFFVFSGVMQLADGLTSNVAVLLVSAGLSQEITKNIWFWHHQPSSVPLGHNYSNPSHLGST